VFSRLGEVNEVQSSVPSCIKRIATLDVKTNGSLKVKRCNLIITNYKTNSNSKGKIKHEEQTSFHPIIVQDADDLKAEIRSTEALESLKNVGDFQHGPANGKSLNWHFL